MMITPEQCRAARAWLGWNQTELAQKAHVNSRSIAGFELGQNRLLHNNREAIARAFTEAGIVIWQDGRAISKA
jgi:DNA-binding XRE family transcriptional regulator